jgi:hypothetical protein
VITPCFHTHLSLQEEYVELRTWESPFFLLKILQFKSTLGWALSNLVALLRWNLFTYRDLWEWINRPYDTPPQLPLTQPELFNLDSMPGLQG